MIRLAMVGLGYWGPNLVRNFASLPGAELAVLCDKDVARAEAIRSRLRLTARVEADYRAVGEDPAVDAVAIATPIQTHAELGRYFLARGKHVLMEKPLARTVAECRALMAEAEARGRVLMVGHVFEYNAAVWRIKEYLERAELGRLLYIYSQRVNLGRVQNDVNALWSFAPHDVSIMNYWLGSEPLRVSARGFSYVTPGVEDVVFVRLEYPGGVGAHLHLGWLDPRKVRQMTLVGTRKMLVYDDVSLDAKLQLHDKGIAKLHEFLESPTTFAEFQVQIRQGDMVTPTLSFSEPLQEECRHFLECVAHGKRPRTDGENGLRVVRVLEAAQHSLERDGATIELGEGTAP